MKLKGNMVIEMIDDATGEVVERVLGVAGLVPKPKTKKIYNWLCFRI